MHKLHSSRSPQKTKLFLILILTALIPFYTNAVEECATEPLSVYLTWQKDPTTTMTIQWITNAETATDDVFYQKVGDQNWKSVAGSHIPLPTKKHHLIHKVELVGLEPGKAYSFQIEKKGSGSCTYKFKTMPNKLDEPIRFVVGGDMYHNGMEYLIETNRQAAKMNPHFALVGGDIAYGGSKTAEEEYKDGPRRWLEWVTKWKENMVTTDGYLIPFLPCIGNHDVNGRYNQPKENAPFFYTLFAFPGSQGYNSLDFGNYMSIISLDSGHTNPIDGAQTQWLHNTLESKQQIPNKFVFYHIPAYPSVRKAKGTASKLERENWSPLFEKYAISAAFEHHDHAYKRTHPILNDDVDPKGVVYFGDGAWGVKNPRTPKRPDQAWYIAESKKERHFILVTVEDKKRQYQAITHEGKVIDTYTQGQQQPVATPAPALQTAGR